MEYNSEPRNYYLSFIFKCWLIGDHLLLRNFGLCGIIFMNVYIITVAMLILLTEFGPYWIIFMTTCFTTLDFPVILDE
jgi:hypothetical protein